MEEVGPHRVLLQKSPIRRKICEEEAGLKPTCSMKQNDEFCNSRWPRSSHAKMMIAGAVNGRLRDKAVIRASAMFANREPESSHCR
jgi:hypothetical protein